MIEELRRFIEIIEENNITRAAENLHLTQSALSQSVDRLEEELGVKLFLLDGKQLRLTTDGDNVAKIGRKILSLWDFAKDSTMRNISEESYTVGLFDNAAIRLGTYLKEIIDSKKYSLDLVIDSSTNLFKLLKLGVIDIAIGVHTAPSVSMGNTVCIKSFKERLLPVTTKIYPKKPSSRIPFILYQKDSRTRNQIDSVFTKAGIQPTVYAESTSTTFMKELALLGSGVAILPENIVAQELRSKRLFIQPLKLSFVRRYGMYARKNHILPEELIDDLANNLTE